MKAVVYYVLSLISAGLIIVYLRPPLEQHGWRHLLGLDRLEVKRTFSEVGVVLGILWLLAVFGAYAIHAAVIVFLSTGLVLGLIRMYHAALR